MRGGGGRRHVPPAVSRQLIQRPPAAEGRKKAGSDWRYASAAARPQAQQERYLRGPAAGPVPFSRRGQLGRIYTEVHTAAKRGIAGGRTSQNPPYGGGRRCAPRCAAPPPWPASFARHP